MCIYLSNICVWIVNFCTFISPGLCDPNQNDQRGPVFSTEPPSRVEFSNSSGAEVRCVADGVPNPNLSWHIKEGGNAPDVPGLRYTRPDGTLVFLPFMTTDYNRMYMTLCTSVWRPIVLDLLSAERFMSK
ncbi:down syndrome cell adhesion molecule-like protein Dscam2 [Caerostris extrusa]|uniref:Down syndrome cell adhesion molecule-like protein Dscam2 n=1 Tax=Caerostris extrusa TaxID=172846 RepID=A0AAV4UK93_CAEEX|nr:down syndrome cell adhesion molecule-like protein Dscam2 [Caerostris extrusa]